MRPKPIDPRPAPQLALDEFVARQGENELPIPKASLYHRVASTEVGSEVSA